MLLPEAKVHPPVTRGKGRGGVLKFRLGQYQREGYRERKIDSRWENVGNLIVYGECTSNRFLGNDV